MVLCYETDKPSQTELEYEAESLAIWEPAILTESHIRRLTARADEIESSNWFMMEAFALAFLLLGAGLKRGELMKLSRNDLVFRDDHNMGKVRIISMGAEDGRAREVPIIPRYVPFLAKYLEIMNEGGLQAQSVFLSCRPGTKGGFKLTDYKVDRRVMMVGAEVMAPNLTVSGCRATWVKSLFDQGMPLKTILALMGYKSNSTVAVHLRMMDSFKG